MSKIFEKTLDQVKASSFVDYRTYLLSVYQFLKAEHDKYSYQRMAEDLGFAPTGIINQIVKGRRNMTVRMATQICKAMGLTGPEKRYLLTLVEYTHALKGQDKDGLFEKMVEIKNSNLDAGIDKDTLEYFSEWYHPVVREMVALSDFDPDPKWISDRVFPKIRINQAENSFELLKRLSLVRWDEEKRRWLQTDKTVKTSRTVKSIALTRFHQKMIDLGKDSITNCKGSQRSITGITVAVDDVMLENLKKRVVDFQLRVLDDCDAEESGDTIYQLNIQLFPVSKPQGG